LKAQQTANRLGKDLETQTQELIQTRQSSTDDKRRAAELTAEVEQLKKNAEELSNPLSKIAVAEWKLVQLLQGAIIQAQDFDRTYLGVLDFAGGSRESVFNDTGLYGSETGLHSIWNDVGLYGSNVGIYSPWNRLCINPPMLIKEGQVLGYMTVNTLYIKRPRIDPSYLRSLAQRLQGKLGQ